MLNIPHTLMTTSETLSGSAEQLQETVKESLDILAQLKEALTGKMYLLIVSLIILVIGWNLINFVCHIVRKSLDRSRLEDSVSGFIFSFVKIGLRILLFIVIIATLGVNMTSIVALFTSAALAIGLALQGSLANFAGGILILVMKPFVVGDYINDGNGHEGTVTAIEVIYTRLLTIDNQTIWIPNGKLADSTIRNSTQSGSRLIDFTVSIGYDEDIDRIRPLLLKAAANCEYVRHDQEPFVFVQEFASSSVLMTLRVMVNPADYLTVKYFIQEEIKKIFDAEGVTIPYEHMDVNIIS